MRLKFAIDKIGVGLNEISIIFGDSVNGDAWDKFIASLKKEEKEESVPVEEIRRFPSHLQFPFLHLRNEKSPG